MTEDLKQEEMEKEIDGQNEEISPEQQEANDQVKRLQDYLRTVVDGLFAEGFPMYAMDTAADIFKSLVVIKSSKSTEWESKVVAGRKLTDTFYDLSSNELTYVQETKPEEVKE